MKGYCVLSFLGGAAIGALVALLVAPESGAVTRHKIAESVRHGEQRMKDAVGEVLHHKEQQA